MLATSAKCMHRMQTGPSSKSCFELKGPALPLRSVISSPAYRFSTSLPVSCRVVKENHGWAGKATKGAVCDTVEERSDALGVQSLLKSVAKGAAVLGLAAALVLGRCMPAEAARSAGRAGGFAGRSSGMTSRSYSGSSGFSGGSSRGYSSGYGSYGGSMFYPHSSSTVIVSPPIVSPPLYGPPVVVGPSYGTGVAVTTGASSMLADAMVLMVLLTVGTMAVTSIMADKGADGGFAGFAGKPTLTKVQVGLVSSARKLKNSLDSIAAQADTDDSEGLQGLLQDVVLALLRNPAYWVYGDIAESKCSSDGELERKFNAASVAERSKFSQETLVNVRSLGRQLIRSGYKPSTNNQSAPDELVVVTLLVATKRPLDLPSKLSSSADMKRCLQALGSVTSDEVMGVELMWTPQAEGDFYTKDECLTEYPNLKLL